MLRPIPNNRFYNIVLPTVWTLLTLCLAGVLFVQAVKGHPNGILALLVIALACSYKCLHYWIERMDARFRGVDHR